MVSNSKYKLLSVLLLVYSSTAFPSKHSLNGEEEQDLIIPKEWGLIKTPIVIEDSDEDPTVVISKLSDKELISLLQKAPKINSKKQKREKKLSTSRAKNRASNQETVYFRLDDKKVNPDNHNIGADPNFLANQKIQNLLYSHPAHDLTNIDSDESDEKKEQLFDLLTAQLKKLCCKSSKSKKKIVKAPKYQPLLKNIFPKSHDTNNTDSLLKYEQMFLILNDDLKSDQDSEILLVDPDSLSKNSSVLLLGPITTPLSDSDLNIVTSRITSELSKPEYTALLQELSEGKVSNAKTHLAKSLVSGSNTRRFVKPHRCRTRYPLAQGPKWLLCTGYLNLNTPSIYD